LFARRYFIRLSLLATLCVSSPGLAQQLRLHGSGAAAHAVGGHQQRELSWGSSFRLGAEWVVLREFGVVLQGSGTFLGAGELPFDKTLRPLDAAKGVSATLGLHLRPFARKTFGQVVSPAGIWLGGGAGLMWTGSERRPMVDAALGFDFLFYRARVGMGPILGWEHIFQPDGQLRPADANILFGGIHGMFEIGVTQGTIDGDQDEDGIRDSRDKCPTVPEDKDNFEDEDGCPDRDNDQDAVLDPDDQCPLVAEDHDKFQDSDGCPEADNDQDGILDASDRCPNDPEDKDNFEDEDGCPDPDNDQDGIPDREDLCPNEPETKNGYADQDGCPDAEQIRVVGDKIVLDDRVHFMINSHIIRNISYPLLERLAALINEHPEYVHIEVQGHTDERGPDWFNERLSQTRADSVMAFLVSHGVTAERLTAKGFGKSKPLVEKRTEYAFYMNRRVEFEITRQIKQKDSGTESSKITVTNANLAPPSAKPPADKTQEQKDAPAEPEEPADAKEAP
jgi:outer membrane protein OmpA-like peptidoglycan-associated protein